MQYTVKKNLKCSLLFYSDFLALLGLELYKINSCKWSDAIVLSCTASFYYALEHGFGSILRLISIFLILGIYLLLISIRFPRLNLLIDFLFHIEQVAFVKLYGKLIKEIIIWFV